MLSLIFIQVIHRDLKLGNLFLNDNLEIKLGDFGLATKVEVEGERKRYAVLSIILPLSTNYLNDKLQHTVWYT